MTPKDLRESIAKNEFNKTTAGMCKGYLQANMLLLPKEYAYSFEKFAKANAKAIPILEILKESPYSKVLAKGANVLNFALLYIIPMCIIIPLYMSPSKEWFKFVKGAANNT